MDGDLPFGFQHTHKRTHAQMEGHEGSLSPPRTSFAREPSVGASQAHSLSQPNPHPHPHPHTSDLHLPRVSDMPPAQQRRHPGDGFDFRRPINYSNYVDLTADDDSGPSYAPPPRPTSRSRRTNNGGPRLPRGMDIIIDLDAEDEQQSAPGPAAPSSPEVEFVASRRVTLASREAEIFERQQTDFGDVEFLSENALPEAEVRRRRERDLDMMADFFDSMDGRFTHLRAQLERTVAHVNRTAAQMRRGGPVAPARSRGPIVGFMAPALDFEMVGFDMGFGGGRAPEPPPPTYEAPDPAPEGFTRSPEEVDVLLCPNCSKELCVGEDEVKRQVWIVKGCGHVYCGECTSNRSIKRSAKGKEKQASSGKTKPFKECVVEGCGKKVSNPKAMIQVFL